MSYMIRQTAGAMNKKFILRILWNPKRAARAMHQQLELNLPATRFGRRDLEVLAGLRRIREELARG